MRPFSKGRFLHISRRSKLAYVADHPGRGKNRRQGLEKASGPPDSGINVSFLLSWRPVTIIVEFTCNYAVWQRCGREALLLVSLVRRSSPIVSSHGLWILKPYCAMRSMTDNARS